MIKFSNRSKKLMVHYNPHRIRVRKIAELYLIALDIEVDKDTKVSDAHLIAKQVENRLKHKHR